MKLSITILAAAAASIGMAQAAPAIVTTTNSDFTKILTTEIKRDQNVDQGEGQRGHDVFLRNADSFSQNDSANRRWGASGTTYNWSLAYDGDLATLILDDPALQNDTQTLTFDIDPDGNFNGFELFIRGDTSRLDEESTTVTVDSVNGMTLDTSLTAVGDENGTFNGFFQLANNMTIASIGGTVTFDFLTNGSGGSPNGTMAFNFKALEFAPVPVPAALPLFVAGFAGLGAAARRRKKA